MNERTEGKSAEAWARLYAQACEAFTALATRDRESLRSAYETTVLPAALATQAARARDGQVFDTLVMTVGIQAYSPALSLTATRARRLVLLATDHPDCRRAVEQAPRLAGIPEDRIHACFFAENTPVATLAESFAQLLREAEREGTVAVDITSGTKPFSLLLASLADSMDLPCLYLEARLLRDGYYHAERRITLPNMNRLLAALDNEILDDAPPLVREFPEEPPAV